MLGHLLSPINPIFDLRTPTTVHPQPGSYPNCQRQCRALHRQRAPRRRLDAACLDVVVGREANCSLLLDVLEYTLRNVSGEVDEGGKGAVDSGLHWAPHG